MFKLGERVTYKGDKAIITGLRKSGFDKLGNYKYYADIVYLQDGELIFNETISIDDLTKR